MTSTKKLTAGVGRALRTGLAAAKAEGAKAVQLSQLPPEAADQLVESTLDYLRARPGKPSHREGWHRLSVAAAGVLPWWAEAASLTPAERRKVGPLRAEVYCVLEQRHLIEADPAGGTSVHVSPPGTPAIPVSSEAPPSSEVSGEVSGVEGPSAGEPVAAWVLKAAPQVYDLGLVFSDPSGLVREWAVELGERADAMRAGQPVFFWLSEGDPYRQPGIWGAGRVVGECVAGVAGAGWLDAGAAARAKLFAQVQVTLYDIPVARSAFLADPRLAETEVIRDPWADNPSFLTATELAALAEYVGGVPTT